MRFVHSFVKTHHSERTGWRTPMELGEDSPHSIAFVLPANGEPDDIYLCELVKLHQNRSEIVSAELVKEGNDSFLLSIGRTKLWFTVRPVSMKDRLLPYVGTLKHPDFEFPFLEIEPEDQALLDRLCEDEGLIIIGCDPETHYLGSRSLMEKQTQVC